MKREIGDMKVTSFHESRQKKERERKERERNKLEICQ